MSPPSQGGVADAPVADGRPGAHRPQHRTGPLEAALDTLTAARGTLARALSTPWRLNLAATTYEEHRQNSLAYFHHPDRLPSSKTRESDLMPGFLCTTE
ncbi:uncharacterized protein SAZU_6013 [Streptomyces azureus]|uniref:Uncharacterized protein n=1 Tax=Streptomyces azureus TaxID=146537 RepID=A0A0K8PTV2_STRAJ|nr:uncharacterized protein SAZU_6013 [Streptomyces azureus]